MNMISKNYHSFFSESSLNDYAKIELKLRCLILVHFISSFYVTFYSYSVHTHKLYLNLHNTVDWDYRINTNMQYTIKEDYTYEKAV